MPSPGSFEVRAAGRLEAVADDLALAMHAAPLPPQVAETVVVQSRGLARWLTLELAKRLGCAAHMEWPFPQHVAGQLLAAHGLTDDAEIDPWSRDDLTWRLMERFAARDLPDEVASYLGDGEARKRHQLATRVADRLDAYQHHRPELIAAWQAGKTGLEHPHAAWQATLWRDLSRTATLSTAATPAAATNRAALMATLLKRLRAGDDTALPPRIWWVVTGVLPQPFVELIEAIATLRPVTVWVMTPSPLEWGGIETRWELARRRKNVKSSTDSADADRHADPGHPLLAHLARQARDWFRWLGGRTTWTDRWTELDLPTFANDSLLACLQQDIATLTDPGSRALVARPRLRGDDRSITVHGCHGERREIEVLKDQILAAFAENDGLRPADVLVLVPDLPCYAPLVEAVFGSGTETLPFRIADRAAAQDDAVAQAFLALLELATGRLGVSEVLAFLRLPAVHSAAGFDDDQVDRMARWCDAAGVRWGADHAHRASAAGDTGTAISDGTWRAALDRLLMGYAVGAVDERVDGIAPVAGVVAGDGELLGRFVSWCERLLSTVADLRQAHAPQAWSAVLQQAITTLLVDDSGDGEAWAVREAVSEFAAVIRRTCTQATSSVPVPVAVIATELAQRLSAERHANGFVSGAITVAALKPMRSIPAQVVALVGMDAGAFPRRNDSQPFDLIAAAPRPGDRDVAGDDRQMFLEALLAARERVIITWTAHAPTAADDEDERQPSSCVQALLDALDATARTDDGRTVSEHLVIKHRRQPFSSAYACSPESTDQLFTFDARAVSIAATLASPRTPLPPLVAHDAQRLLALPETPAEPVLIDLEDLERFWKNPAEAWCRAALGFAPGRDREARDDDEPFALSALARTVVGDQALRRGPAALDRARDDGQLPPGALGAAHQRVFSAALTQFSKRLPASPSTTQWRRVAVSGNGWRLSGQIPFLAGQPPYQQLVVWRFAALKPMDRLRAGLAHLVWCAMDDHAGVTKIIASDTVIELPPVADAVRRLETLIQGRAVGLTTPLPFFLATSRAAVERLAKGDEPGQIPARSAVQTAWNDEQAQAAVALAWRGCDPLTAMNDAWLEWSWRAWEALDPMLNEECRMMNGRAER